VVVPFQSVSPRPELLAPLSQTGASDRRPSDTLSAVEDRPADVVPQPLVVEHELANSLWEPVALPSPLESSRSVNVSFPGGSTGGLDGIGGRTELVRSDVGDGRGLTGRVRGMPCCPDQVSGGAVCMTGGRAGLSHRYLPARPGPPEFDGVTRTVIAWARSLEVVQHVLCAVSRPDSKELVVRIDEHPTTAHGHKAEVAVFREDHSATPIVPSSADRQVQICR
jgi:hypothetical protein